MFADCAAKTQWNWKRAASQFFGEFGGTGFSLCDVQLRKIKTTQAEACATGPRYMKRDSQKDEIEKLRREVENLHHLARPEIPAADLVRLRGEVTQLRQEFYEHLGPWQRTLLARHPQRPYMMDYVRLLFEDFHELHGDRAYGDDAAMIAGFAKYHGRPVVVIGQQKGRDTKEKIYRNFGYMHPEGYRRALRLMHMAEKFNLPVITLIDTPGAYPGIGAEERGQSEAIARNLYEMAKLKTPIIVVVIGEGCSGGALGIGVGDKIPT